MVFVLLLGGSPLHVQASGIGRTVASIVAVGRHMMRMGELIRLSQENQDLRMNKRSGQINSGPVIWDDVRMAGCVDRIRPGVRVW